MLRLAAVLAKWRWAEKLSLREAAAEMGLTLSTLQRIETRDGDLDGATLAKIIRWLLTEVDDKRLNEKEKP
jgi:transcriptional regulator with XRE-family HTH domain